MPSGNMWTGNVERIARTNAALGGNLAELLATPIRPVSGATVYLRDIGTIESGTDLVTAYAHVNGKRTVYIPVTKRSDAFHALGDQRREGRHPDFKKWSPTTSMSASNSTSRRSSPTRSAAGFRRPPRCGPDRMMVLIFLRDWRSALIVVANIPFALLTAVILLWAAARPLTS